MSKVAVLRTTPETVVEDYGRLMDLAGYRDTLAFDHQTCLRINISWHVYMPACSTTPWQMHGVIEKLGKDGYNVSRDLIAAQNDTVVVSCREGAIKNNLQPVLDRFQVPIQYLSEPPTEWVTYQPKSKLLVLDRVGKGRVAEFLSDQEWLWARGFEGGGPQAELLRRLAHWLMKEPELEEERLSASIINGQIAIERHTMADAAKSVFAAIAAA